MVFGWLSYYTPRDYDERAGRRLANRPHRGDRAKVKAGRKAARKGRR